MSRTANLLDLVHQRAMTALRSGALQPIATDERLITDAGIRFVVRSVSSLRQKATLSKAIETHDAAAQQLKNPFLPYEPDLFVADVGETHVCLLNKFNVIPHHVLIVTRRFECQDALLTRRDFAALWRCQASIKGLCFYNGGTAAGASQPHKHMQIVPLPLSTSAPELSVDCVIDKLEIDPHGFGKVLTAPSFPFRHALACLAPSYEAPHSGSADVWHDLYRSLLSAAGIGVMATNDGLQASQAYNLLITQRWMLVVPRSRESYRGISLNALGFAGSLFVREVQDFNTIETIGPMRILRHVSLAI